VVGDLALYLCGSNADIVEFERNPASFDLPDSVIGFLSGELGVPAGGWPEPFRTRALAGKKQPVRVLDLPAETKSALADADRSPQELRQLLNSLLFPALRRNSKKPPASSGIVRPTHLHLFLRPVSRDEVEVTLDAGLSLYLASTPSGRRTRAVSGPCSAGSTASRVW